jgi:hypothetical protein
MIKRWPCPCHADTPNKIADLPSDARRRRLNGKPSRRMNALLDIVKFRLGRVTVILPVGPITDAVRID